MKHPPTHAPTHPPATHHTPPTKVSLQQIETTSRARTMTIAQTVTLLMLMLLLSSSSMLLMMLLNLLPHLDLCSSDTEQISELTDSRSDDSLHTR